MNPFTSHPATVGESYTEHLATATGFGGRMILAGMSHLFSQRVRGFRLIDLMALTLLLALGIAPAAAPRAAERVPPGEGADHSEGAWARRVDPALRFLFPPLPPKPETVQSKRRLIGT